MGDNMNDRLYLIDIDGIEEEVRCAICKNQIKTDKGCDGNCKYDESMFRKITTMLDRRIELLPFNQPEIVRCKDCKHHWTHKCMDSIPIERCDLEQTFYDAEVDYCSLAERRKDG